MLGSGDFPRFGADGGDGAAVGLACWPPRRSAIRPINLDRSTICTTAELKKSRSKSGGGLCMGGGWFERRKLVTESELGLIDERNKRRRQERIMGRKEKKRGLIQDKKAASSD